VRSTDEGFVHCRRTVYKVHVTEYVERPYL